MTVRELIEALAKCDPQARAISTRFGDYDDPVLLPGFATVDPDGFVTSFDERVGNIDIAGDGDRMTRAVVIR